MVSEVSARWLAAGKALAPNPTAKVKCPECGRAGLVVTDAHAEPLPSDGCNAHHAMRSIPCCLIPSLEGRKFQTETLPDSACVCCEKASHALTRPCYDSACESCYCLFYPARCLWAAYTSPSSNYYLPPHFLSICYRRDDFGVRGCLPHLDRFYRAQVWRQNLGGLMPPKGRHVPRQ
jgi:hypothetical protein